MKCFKLKFPNKLLKKYFCSSDNKITIKEEDKKSKGTLYNN